MKILHTSDLHLTEKENPHREERWTALRTIISEGNRNKVNLMVISGDLFDSDRAGNAMRATVRAEFERASFPIVVIAGNHDSESYPEGVFFGENVKVIRDLFNPVELEGVSVWGFPYKDLRSEKILLMLRRAAKEVKNDVPAVLLLHGELLDISGIWENYGNEGASRYFPVRLSYFAGLPWNYVLAGHFHTNFDINRFGDAGYFVYPGSPVSVTEKETGIRKVNIFEPGKVPSEHPVSSFFYESLEITLNPFKEDDPLESIKKRLSEVSPAAALLVRINGFYDGRKLNMSEEKLSEGINKLLKEKNCSRKIFEFKDLGRILEDETYKEFCDKLAEESRDEQRNMEIKNLLLRAVMEA
ncbi:MAG: DNA repair exonuclease [Spirochaetes bacterium]|nr:DNA repair exonuclease [Spirochaetota bacterium]